MHKNRDGKRTGQVQPRIVETSECSPHAIIAEVISVARITAIDKSEIDIYCVYCPTTDECYDFDPAEFNRSVTLRVKMPKNNQSKNVKLATDFRRVP